MDKPQIVLDTNVLISGLRSNRGASFRLLSLIDSDLFDLNVSVPLVLEYEEVCTRQMDELSLSASDIASVINYLCRVSHHRAVSFLWRPWLSDPADDMILELAVAAGCSHIVTFNIADFREASQFGLSVVKPQRFLQEIGELP